MLSRHLFCHTDSFRPCIVFGFPCLVLTIPFRHIWYISPFWDLVEDEVIGTLRESFTASQSRTVFAERCRLQAYAIDFAMSDKPFHELFWSSDDVSWLKKTGSLPWMLRCSIQVSRCVLRGGKNFGWFCPVSHLVLHVPSSPSPCFGEVLPLVLQSPFSQHVLATSQLSHISVPCSVITLFQ